MRGAGGGTGGRTLCVCGLVCPQAGGRPEAVPLERDARHESAPLPSQWPFERCRADKADVVEFAFRRRVYRDGAQVQVVQPHPAPVVLSLCAQRNLRRSACDRRQRQREHEQGKRVGHMWCAEVVGWRGHTMRGYRLGRHLNETMGKRSSFVSTRHCLGSNGSSATASGVRANTASSVSLGAPLQLPCTQTAGLARSWRQWGCT